jgi:hypothetical protein
MEDLKESSDVLLILFSGNLLQSVIVLGKTDSFLYSVLQDGIWKRLVWECRFCLFCGMSLSVFGISTLSFTIL